jgi:hypothetical protein
MPGQRFLVAADLVVLLHAGFVLFVILGGLLVWRWRRLLWIHVPAVLWGVLIEFGGWICPLTPLENHLRERGGMATYQGDFIGHLILPVLYPASLRRIEQLFLGIFALAVNGAIYWRVLGGHRGSSPMGER